MEENFLKTSNSTVVSAKCKFNRSCELDEDKKEVDVTSWYY